MIEIKLPDKLKKRIRDNPELFEFRVIDKNIVLFEDNVATSYIFATPQNQRRIAYIKSFKIMGDQITIKEITV